MGAEAVKAIAWEDARKELLATSNPFERRLLFAAWLSEQTTEVVMKPVVVGGHALEAHTGNEYTTGDLDLLVAHASHEVAVLRACGFEHEGRVWWHQELALAVDLIEQPLAGEWERILEVETPLGLARLLGPEDIILDRLNAVVHWGVDSELIWVETVMRKQRQLDWDYLERRAREDGVSEQLDELRRKAERREANNPQGDAG